jgi:hypothetical protein
MLAKQISGDLWKLIVRHFYSCWQNGSRKTSGSSLQAFLKSAGKIVLRKPLEAHFQHVYGLLTKFDCKQHLRKDGNKEAWRRFGCASALLSRFGFAVYALPAFSESFGEHLGSAFPTLSLTMTSLVQF